MRLLAVSLLLFGLVLGGCRAVDVHFDDRRPRQRIQTMWQVQLDELEMLPYHPTQTAVPAYGRGGRVVVAGSDAGDVVAADAHTGRVLWRFATRSKIRGGATIVGDAVYVGDSNGRMVRLDLQSGAEDWPRPYSTQGSITSAPALGGGRVVFQNNRSRTYALDSATGAYLWDQGRPRPAFLTIKGEGGVAIADDVVYAGYDDGNLVAMRLDDGATVWSRSLTGDHTQFVDVDTRPVVAGDLVYAASFAGGLYALNREHGNIKWVHHDRGIQTPALGDRLLYVCTGGHRVKALDPLTGKVQWEARFDYGRLSAPTVRADHLWVPTTEGLLLMDAERASVLARITPDYGQTGSVVSSGGWIHMVTNSGALVGARVL